ncbi:MAG: DUF4342 domain-containing protein [Acidobacteriia bacterium]|nr:DUF4342 domain-containing protein [Terriglobia bacterium]
MRERKTRTEEFHLDGEHLVAKIKELIRDGDIIRITLKDKEGTTLIEVPLSLGIAGAVMSPVWAAIAATSVLSGELTMVVEKIEDEGHLLKFV